MKAIRTKYLGPTNRRGSRIQASDLDHNRVTIPYDHALNSDELHRKAAVALCQKMNWHGRLAQGGFKDGDVFVFVGDGSDIFDV